MLAFHGLPGRREGRAESDFTRFNEGGSTRTRCARSHRKGKRETQWPALHHSSGSLGPPLYPEPRRRVLPSSVHISQDWPAGPLTTAASAEASPRPRPGSFFGARLPRTTCTISHTCFFRFLGSDSHGAEPLPAPGPASMSGKVRAHALYKVRQKQEDRETDSPFRAVLTLRQMLPIEKTRSTRTNRSAIKRGQSLGLYWEYWGTGQAGPRGRVLSTNDIEMSSECGGHT